MGRDRLAALRVCKRCDRRHATDTPPRPSDRQSPPSPRSNCSASRPPMTPPRTRPCLHSMPRCALFRCHARRVDLALQTTSIQESIAEFDANVTAIADLHARSLNALSEQDSAANHSRLAELTESTRAHSNALSKRIQALKVRPGGASTQDAEIRKNRVRLRRPNHNHVTETGNHRRSHWCTESLSRHSRDTRTSSNSIGRGTRIVWNGSSRLVIPLPDLVTSRFDPALHAVKPDATADEISAIVNDTQGGSNTIFQQAVGRSFEYF